MESEKQQIDWIEYDLLKSYQKIQAKTFLRHGGSSKPPFFSLNTSLDVGDNSDCVRANRSLIQNIMQLEHTVFAKQVHGVEVHKVDSVEQGIFPADSIYTKKPGIGLAITHADCQAAIIYDPVVHLVALVHAGWKGLVEGVYQRCVEHLISMEGCDPKNFLVGIGPSLCSEHAEFINYKKEFPQDLWSFMQMPNHFNLRDMAKSGLIALGIHEENIEFSSLCTACNVKECFSHRGEKKTGRHATIAVLYS